MKLDTANHFGVVVNGNIVRLTNWYPLPLQNIRLLPDQALNLACWIMALGAPLQEDAAFMYRAGEVTMEFGLLSKVVVLADGKLLIPSLPVCAFEVLDPHIKLEVAVGLAGLMIYAVDRSYVKTPALLREIKGL